MIRLLDDSEPQLIHSPVTFSIEPGRTSISPIANPFEKLLVELFLSSSLLMDGVPWGPALILIQHWEQWDGGRNRGGEKKSLEKENERGGGGGGVLKQRVGRGIRKGARLLWNTYPWWRHWLMDWARSATPRDEIAAAARTHNPEASIHTHTRTQTHTHRHTHRHTVGRTEDETTLCQHGTLPAMLMKFIWIQVGLYRREKGGWKGWKAETAAHADWKTTEKW